MLLWQLCINQREKRIIHNPVYHVLNVIVAFPVVNLPILCTLSFFKNVKKYMNGEKEYD